MSSIDSPDVSPGREKRSRKRGALLPATVVAIGLVVAAVMLKGGTTKAGAVPAVPPPTTAAPDGPVVKFDDITLNLADGHYLKVGIGLQLSRRVKADSYSSGAAGAKAMDLAISLLGDKTYAELATPDGRQRAKSSLQAAIVTAYHGEVVKLYFTDFVMQ